MTDFLNPDLAYDHFERDQWQQLRSEEPLTLTQRDMEKLNGFSDPVSLEEVEQVYLPLSRLLSFYVTDVQQLHQATARFLSHSYPKVPYVIGVAGSVAVGKSTTSRVLQALLSRWPNHPVVEIVTTDGFLYSTKELQARNLMQRKGFPESYDVGKLLNVLHRIKSGEKNISVPIYSHHHYDVLPNKQQILQAPDIVILEGLNILQINKPNQASLFVSDYLDFSLYVDADSNLIKKWFLERVMTFWRGPFQAPDAYFHFLTKMTQEEVMKFAERVWCEINEENLTQNILPFKYRANLILTKGEKHAVEQVSLRKL